MQSPCIVPKSNRKCRIKLSMPLFFNFTGILIVVSLGPENSGKSPTAFFVQTSNLDNDRLTWGGVPCARA